MKHLTVCSEPRPIAALFVEAGGVYSDPPGVDPWDVERDARAYRGPHPVVAHPPCERWGRFWHGSPRKPHQYRLGDDDGCFSAALWAARTFGGVIEHPADSHAWRWFGLPRPTRGAGWTEADQYGGRSCYVDQAHYGHSARKPTWLYAVGGDFPELDWTPSEQRLHPVAVAKYGYAKARRSGMVSMIGGKDKKAIRNRTPTGFRDVLIGIARGVTPSV